MCGLTLCVTPADGHIVLEDRFDQLLHSIKDENNRRGPDANGVYATRVKASAEAKNLLVIIQSSVLGLRGGLTPQPLVGHRGVLAWNGQVFDGVEVPIEQNDTRKLFHNLEAGISPKEVFSTVEGPFAYIYLEFSTLLIHFGVDPLSRRSLILHAPQAPIKSNGTTLSSVSFILTSARSDQARAQHLTMQALQGGQAGVLDLAAVKFADGVPDYMPALQTWIRQPLKPINTAVPCSADWNETRAAEEECPRFVARLTEAVRRRVQNIPPQPDKSPRIALLFSGGVDCSLLAALVHRCLPDGEPIELVNVAFQQPPKGKVPNKSSEADQGKIYDVPDRISGREAAAELRRACPGREFIFVEVDVTVEESKAHRPTVVNLMYPNNTGEDWSICTYTYPTEMDLSLAYPLYFASRGYGIVRNGAETISYQTKAKVYISGLGADEQLAGYTRHRRAFDRGSWEGLIEEIQLDLDRIPQRNLSRDDRVISSHARDARYPFLDLAFVDYVSSLPVWAKCDLTLVPGTGDKLLVRLAAKHCGLVTTAGRVKRAMQFGTKSAKLNEAPKGYRVGEGLIEEAS